MSTQTNMSTIFELQTIYPDPVELSKATKRLSDPDAIKSYDIVEQAWPDRAKETPLKQTICRWDTRIDGASNIEHEFRKYGLQELGIDWGYVGGCPVLYVTTAIRLAGADLDKIERLIHSKGLKTFGGMKETSNNVMTS